MKIHDAIKQNKFSSNVDMAVVNIVYTSNWLHDKQKKFFSKHNIKAQHYNILRILKGRHPAAASPGEIKEVMLDKAPDLTRLIDKLVNQNLAERYLCEQNRRKVDVFITDKGISLLKLIAEDMKEVSDDWKSKITEDEAGTLSDLLDKLRN